MSSIICIKINLHNKALAEAKFPSIKEGFMKEMDKNPGAKMLQPKVYLDNGLIFIEINAFMESVARKVMPTIKDSLVKSFLEQAKRDGLTASIDCYLKE